MATFATALLAKDVKTEELSEERELRRAERARQRQGRSQALFGTLGGIAGLAFGPIGSFVGKQIGKFGADLLSGAEKTKVSRGKFSMSQSDELNRQLRDFDRSENIGNLVGTATDLLGAFTMGGGFEAIRGGAGIGETILSKDVWTKFGGTTPSLYDFFKNDKTGKAKIGDYFKMLRGEEDVFNQGFNVQSIRTT